MAATRRIEIFSAGCAVCKDTITRVQDLACPSCDITIHDMNQADIATRAQALGIRSVPALVIDGKLADCYAARGPDESKLKPAGLGVRLN